MTRPPIGPTNPEAGVIDASPAIVPVTRPISVGLPNLIQSIVIQTIEAVAAEICVTNIAIPASSLAARALPALNPNQPTHNIAAPIITKAGLCGGSTWSGKPFLGPNAAAKTSAEIPAVK